MTDQSPPRNPIRASEEYDPAAHRQLGNVPQGFSHIGLVNSAYNLATASRPAEQRQL